MRKKLIIVPVLAVVLFITLLVVSILFVNQSNSSRSEPEEESEVVSTEEPEPASHMMKDAEKYVLPQVDLMAGCETYAATMLFHILGFDIDEFSFANQYLDCHYIYEDEDGNKQGPDMYSAFAGTAYAGWGVYSPSMAKSMNRYLKDQKSELQAYNAENVPLETLCEEYVSNDIPVMVWATTDMADPIVTDSWTVNYVDENAKHKIGDTVEWYAHEHCLVMVGYSEDEYFFCDSAAGKISHFKKDLVAKRYEQLGSQSIVVK